MTTSRKLWLGFGTLTALLVLSAVTLVAGAAMLETPNAIGPSLILLVVGVVVTVATGVTVNNSVLQGERVVAEYGERLRTTLASIGDGVISTDRDGNVTYLNAVAESLTGWTNAEAKGVPLTRVFHIVNEGTRQPVENPALRALKEGMVVGLANHTILITKDGTERPIDDSAAPIRCKEGELVGCVLVFRDVTERRAAEIALAERTRLVAVRADVGTALAAAQPTQAGLQGCCEALVRHLGVAFARVWTHDEAGGVLELQASAGRYTHLDGPHSRVKVGEFKIGRIAATRRPHLTNDVPHDPNVSDQAWAGREGMVAFAGYPLLVEGRVIGVMAMFARHPLSEVILPDLTPLTDQIAQYIDRKRAEELVRQSEANWRAVVESITDAMFSLDREWRFTYANPQAEQLLDHPPGDLIGKVLWDEYPDLAGSEFEATYRRTVREQVPLTVTAYYPGHDRWYEVRTYPSAVGLTVYFQNVTERKRLEAQRHQFVSMAEKSQDLIGMAGMDQTPFFVNEAGQRMVGLDADRVSRVKVLDFFPEDQGRVRDEIVPQVMRDGHAEEEIRFRNFTTGKRSGSTGRCSSCSTTRATTPASPP